MLKGVYDTDNDGIVDKAEALNDGSSGDGNNVTASETRNAVDIAHEHSNKTELDLITDGDHDVRTDNPHEVILGDVIELYSAEDETESVTTSETYVEKLNLTFTPDAQADFLVSWYYELTHSNAGKSSHARIELDDTTEIGISDIVPHADSHYSSFSGIKKINLTDVEHTIDIDFLRDTLPGNVKIRRARIVVQRVS